MKRYFNSSTKPGTGSRRYNHNNPAISEQVIAAIKQLGADLLERTDSKSTWMSGDHVYELFTKEERVVQMLIYTLPLARQSKPRTIKLVSNHLEENGQPLSWSAFAECLK